MYPTVSIARVLENGVLENYDPIQSELAENPTLREEALTTTSQGGRHRLSFSSSLRRRGKGHPVVPSFCSGASRKAHGGRPVARGTLRRTWAGARSTCCEARLNALTLARGGPISSGCLPENGAGNFGKFTRTGDALARTWSKPDFTGSSKDHLRMVRYLLGIPSGICCGTRSTRPEALIQPTKLRGISRRAETSRDVQRTSEIIQRLPTVSTKTSPSDEGATTRRFPAADTA
jgi:hypothetical protein